MLSKSMGYLVVSGIAMITLLSGSSFASAQTWTPLTHPMPSLCQFGGGDAPMLLTDGTVLVQDYSCSDYWRLTPDEHGSYVNGTWTQAAALAADYAPLYHSAAVLPDGRAIIEGGEYNFGVAAFTTLGAIYDPVANTWTAITPPSFFGGCCGFSRMIGDAQSIVLSNGKYMQADCCGNEYTGNPPSPAALLNAKTLKWTETGAGKADAYDEEGWTLLPNGNVLTVDANNTSDLTNSELYNPASGRWQSAGSTIVKLEDTNADNSGSHEMGPQVLRPDGTVIAFGATGHNAIYNSHTGKWTVGPDFPDIAGQGRLDVADGPAALLPDGNVLVAASPGVFNPPSHFFEFDGAKLNPVPAPPTAPNYPSFPYDMLVLPTGQVLLTSQSSDIEIYTPKGTYQQEWRPIVLFTPLALKQGGSYEIYGLRFNGWSQGAAYGDDYQNATNYPLVRITNVETGHVFYSRTHDHSSMAVASNNLVSTHYDVPAGQERGFSKLEVVANGIPSFPVFLWIQ